MDKARFIDACSKIIGNERERIGIGTLSEKTLHAVLKHYFEPDSANHEIKVGRFFADIKNEHGIVEIQTRSFNAIRTKLAAFLESGLVTVVYPIAYRKDIIWLDNQSVNVTKKRKSPRIGTAYEAFFELYKIKSFLTHPNFRLCIVLVDTIEYRNLDGWSIDKKKGASRHERIPKDIVDEIYINCIEDYKKLIPNSLPEFFTSKDFKKASGLNLSAAQIALNVLKSVGAIIQTSKQGNALVYSIKNI